MASFSNIDIEESATVTKSVGSVTIARGSTNEEQEILCLGDPDTSNAIAAITNAAPASTRWGLNVRIVGGPSSVADLAVRAVLSSTAADNPVNVSSLAGQVSVGEYSTAVPAVGSTGLVVRLASTGVRVINSSAADLLANVSSVAGRVLADQNSTTWAVQVDGRVRAQNSTIGDLLASVQQNSTVWAVQVDGRVRAQNSTIGDLLASVQQNSTVWAAQIDGRVRAQNSTIGDLLASVQQNSTVWQTQAKIQDSSGVSPSIVNSAPSTSLQGLVVREVVSGMNSTTVTITSTHSTALYSLISSVAGAQQKVTAYFIGSTHTNPSTFVFMSSNVIDRWGVNFGSGSSGVTGANLAVGAPSWLFNTDAANALNCRIEGGSSVTATVVARVSITWFSAV